nr:YHYH domain-containing protein [Methylibium petroleiphilum]
MLAAAVASLPALAAAHGGGLNAAGCHHNRKTGDYHCHRAPAAGPRDTAPVSTTGTARAQNLSEQAGRSAVSAPPSAGGPTCYVGPRGGTYTITASGRKNYSGC